MEYPALTSWFCDRGNFWGTINQLCLCARCGKNEHKRYDEKRHYGGIFTPHLHMLCDECFDELPEKEPVSSAVEAETPTP